MNWISFKPNIDQRRFHSKNDSSIRNPGHNIFVGHMAFLWSLNLFKVIDPDHELYFFSSKMDEKDSNPKTTGRLEKMVIREFDIRVSTPNWFAFKLTATHYSRQNNNSTLKTAPPFSISYQVHYMHVYCLLLFFSSFLFFFLWGRGDQQRKNLEQRRRHSNTLQLLWLAFSCASGT